MTKAEIIKEVAERTGVERKVVSQVVESFVQTMKETMIKGEPVYFRGFGSFIIKKRARKTARDIAKNTTIIIPEHNRPFFKPSKAFMDEFK